MKLLRDMGVLVILIPFLFSVSGILVLQSHCLCTGKNSASIYVQSPVCTHENHDETGCTDCSDNDNNNCSKADNTCSVPANNCGCDTPEAEFHKLTEPFSFEFKPTIKPLTSFVIFLRPVVISEIAENKVEVINSRMLAKPPPVIFSSSDFIYFIHQPRIFSIV